MFFSPLALLAGAILFAALVIAVQIYVRSVKQDVRLFRAVAEGASDGLVLMRRDSRIVWTNKAYSRIMGYDHGELVNRYPLEFALPPHLAVSTEESRSFRFDEREERFGRLTQLENVRKDGSAFIHEFSHAAIRVGVEPRFLLVSRDITERVEREKALLAAQEKLKWQSRTDGLTGLFNRSHMQSKLNDLMERASPFAVLLIDVNRMKQVNDTFGHLAGDALLLQVARAMRSLADDTWLCARTGGDEFVVLLSDAASLGTAQEMGHWLALEAAKPFVWEAATLTAEVSVGAAMWDLSITSSDELLNRADVALYEAKTSAEPGVVCYDEELERKHKAAQRFEKEVVRVVREQRFCFHFQPIVDTETGRVTKFEMLIRWYHSDEGMIPPDRFLPVVEQLRLNPQLDKLVIHAAERTLRQLDAAGLDHVGLSINLSSDALSTPEITDQLMWSVECDEIDPNRVTVEVLESTALIKDGNDLPIRLICRLRETGFKVFLDDFGMGYAGLAHLASLPADGLKVDRGLSSAVDVDATSRLIVNALVGLARELGMQVVAEGVETAAQMELVQEAGCSMFQGYAVARPMPLKEAVAWALDERSAPTGTGG